MRRRGGDALGVEAILLVVVVLVALFCLWPLVALLARTLEGGPMAAWERATDVLADAAPLIVNSTFSGALASLLACAIALAVALWQVFGRPWTRRILQGVTLLSMASPPFVASLAYIQLFGRRGLITHGLLGLDSSPYGWPGVVVMQGLFFCGLDIILITSVLRRIDPALLKAARDLGARSPRVFVDIIVPLLRPTLAACFLLTFMRSVSDYGTPVVIGGAFETVATQIYVQLVGFSDLAGVAVLNVVLLMVSGLVWWTRRRLDEKTESLVAGTYGAAGAASGAVPWRPRGGLRVVLATVAGAFSAFIVVLYATIVRTAFIRGAGVKGDFTLDNFAHLLEYDLAPLGRSVLFAALAALAACLIGCAVAYFCHRRAIPGSRLLSLGVSVPYMIPGTCLGLGFILAFNRGPLALTGTAAILVAVLAVKELAIATDAFSTTLDQLPRTLDKASRDLGAGELATFARVLWPNLRSAVGVCLVNGISAGMMSYGALLFLVAPTTKTGVVQLFDALSGGRYGQAAALAVVLMAVTLAATALSNRLASRAPGRRVIQAASMAERG